MLSAAQIKAARELLGWTQHALSAASGVGLATVKRLEQGPMSGDLVLMLFAVKRALEDAGIEFDGEVGVSLRKPKNG